MKKYSVFALIALLLAGCDGEPTRDVQYYSDHADERAEKLKECQNNPGELEHSPNCKNAIQADDQEFFSNKNKTMPTIR